MIIRAPEIICDIMRIAMLTESERDILLNEAMQPHPILHPVQETEEEYRRRMIAVDMIKKVCSTFKPLPERKKK